MSTAEDTPKEEFQVWLFYMDDALDQFMNRLPVALQSTLNFTPKSLDTLEAWILERYATIRAIQQPSEVDILDGLARYVGETFRKELGGQWQLRQSDPSDAFYGLPELSKFGVPVPPICPHRLVTASIDRRAGQYLRTVLASSKNLLESKRSSA